MTGSRAVLCYALGMLVAAFMGGVLDLQAGAVAAGGVASGAYGLLVYRWETP